MAVAINAWWRHRQDSIWFVDVDGDTADDGGGASELTMDFLYQQNCIYSISSIRSPKLSTLSTLVFLRLFDVDVITLNVVRWVEKHENKSEHFSQWIFSVDENDFWGFNAISVTLFQLLCFNGYTLHKKQTGFIYTSHQPTTSWMTKTWDDKMNMNQQIFPFCNIGSFSVTWEYERESEILQFANRTNYGWNKNGKHSNFFLLLSCATAGVNCRQQNMHKHNILIFTMAHQLRSKLHFYIHDWLPKHRHLTNLPHRKNSYIKWHGKSSQI